jgi:hypothetical protein
MSLDIISKIGQKIGALSEEQDDIKQNINPDEAEGFATIFTGERINIGGILTLNRLTIATDSFVVDHVVYGYVDSSVLKIDGGYVATSAAATFPLTFPITFVGSTLIATYLI